MDGARGHYPFMSLNLIAFYFPTLQKIAHYSNQFQVIASVKYNFTTREIIGLSDEKIMALKTKQIR